ncbi:hypothetical protein RFM99_18985 [Mesorhizobium sp. VK4C]|uniref:hypothetical protein n=1 Tax=Mesorhizobium captivum TaxID=3072319 RepID=UPI002A24C057|nr:hypothetical protein [Mesorhizobium sp. VK4C]MDX8500497.1 hypothetical protein [Mesorhizobium sp. VK4C]
MAFDIVHNIDKAVRQLLEAPNDLAELMPDQGAVKSMSEATDQHRDIYAKYIANFDVAYQIADDWWEGCVAAYTEDGYGPDEANELAYDKRLAGPASAPEVVWFFRNYWLAFDEVNRALPPKDRVPPQVAMLGWLVEEGRTDYVRLLTCMPYWPIGLDENGNWC